MFTRIRNGEFANGSRTLQIRIGMASLNINLRDPAIYRIHKIPQNTRGAWPIYPMPDCVHCISDALGRVADPSKQSVWSLGLRHLTPRVPPWWLLAMRARGRLTMPGALNPGWSGGIGWWGMVLDARGGGNSLTSGTGEPARPAG